MIETFGMTGMIVLAFLALVAFYILMRVLKGNEGQEEDDEADGGEPEERKPEAEYAKRPAGMSDEEFIESYTGPIIDDALEALDTGVDYIRSGCLFYGRGAWVEAGSEFHSAAKKIDEASGRLREVSGMVEDQGSGPAVQAKARIGECMRLRKLTILMEEACDAMVEGKEEEASRLSSVKPDLEQMAAAFKRD